MYDSWGAQRKAHRYLVGTQVCQWVHPQHAKQHANFNVIDCSHIGVQLCMNHYHRANNMALQLPWHVLFV